jgi:DNA-binding transcriptional MerR regulator
MRTFENHRFGTDLVASLAHVTYRQVDWWLRTGLLPEPAVPAKGPGSAREFDWLDLMRVRVVAELRMRGVTLQAIRRALEILSSEWGEHDPLLGGRLLTIDGAVFYRPTEAELWHILARQRAFRHVVTLDVGGLARQTAEAVEALVAA